ncbi:MAG TPA: adenylate/guanylate cyclase domain-containing protein, partial [Acidimicrobiales bacterium]|nr:adenylate/guanylate cyclase domain-containing protein [Acidimicrobiales bacterium]
MPGCPRCHAENPEGYRFCGACGAPLQAVICASCASPNPPGQHFCGQCGAALDQATSPATAPAAGPALEERKLATVLFADVVGFTSLAERTDPEVVTRMVDAAFSELAQVVTEYGGTVDKYLGDSLMAVFGVPLAHDDDAERAVAAALAMRQLGGDLVFAIGLNSGEVMVSAPGGGDTTVIGDTVNVAARLEKAAAPGEVLCGRLTVELAGARVEFDERQPVLLKGKSEPVEVWAARRLRRAGDGRGERPALVGRQEELGFLDTELRRLRDEGQGSLVVICGEAGSGKTRLLDELADRAAGCARVVRASYPTFGVLGGRQVAADLLEQLGPSADPDVEARVRSVLGELDPALRAIEAAGIEREQVWAMGQLIKERTSEQPLVVLIDDLHGADPKTLELLGQLAVYLRDQPLLTVVAGRAQPSSWLSSFTTTTTLRLRALSRPQALSLAEILVGGHLAEDASAFFAERAKGNPLYLRELVAVARQRGVLVSGPDGYHLTAERVVPASLQALLAARLDALEREQKALFQQLSVLGKATGAELGELTGQDCAAAMAGLADSGLVRFDPDGSYEPADPLLGEVAYDMLPRSTRGELHRRAAAVVEQPEARLVHLEKAAGYRGDDRALAEEAAEALAAAGLQMIEGFRHLDAMRLLEKAVELGLRRPPVLLELARVQGACGKSGEALATLALVPDDPGDPTLAAERDHTGAMAKTFDDPAWAAPRLLDAAERWRQLGNVEKEAWAHANAGVATFYTSQMAQAAAELERGLELFESIGDRAGAVAASSFLCLARPEDPRVERWLTEALAFANETGDRNRQATTLATLSWKHFIASLHGTAREMAPAEEAAARLCALSEELGMLDMTVHGRALRAFMMRQTGRFEEARHEADALAQLLSPPRRHNESWLGWAASFTVALATDSPDAAAPYPPEDSVDPVVAMAGVLIVAALALAGRGDEVVGRLEHGSRSFEGAIADLGGVVAAMGLVLSGQTEAARERLERAHKAAEVFDARGVLRSAEAMLAEVDGRAPEMPAGAEEPS